MTSKPECDKIESTKGKHTKGDKKMFEVFVAGSSLGVFNNRADAEKRLDEAKNSFLRMVHPVDVFYIKEK